MYGAFHPDAQKGGENDTLLTNKAKSGSECGFFVAVGALCAVSGALVGAYALSGSNGYGVSSLMRLGASETCGMDHCLTLLQGPSDQLDSIFQESFDTVCTQANQVVEQGSTHGLKENPKALCTVPKCFDILNAELGKVSKDETKQQSMKDVVITQFYDVCFPTSTAAMGKNKHQTKVAKVGHNAHAVAPKTSTKRSRLGSQCNVDSCLVLLRADNERLTTSLVNPRPCASSPASTSPTPTQSSAGSETPSATLRSASTCSTSPSPTRTTSSRTSSSTSSRLSATAAPPRLPPSARATPAPSTRALPCSAATMRPSTTSSAKTSEPCASSPASTVQPQRRAWRSRGCRLPG